MKILYVTHFNPWEPKYGAAFRSYGILRGLSQKHDLHIALASVEQKEIADFSKGSNGFQHLYTLPHQIPAAHPERAAQPAGPTWGSRIYRKPFLELLQQLQPQVVWYFTKYSLRLVGLPAGQTPTVLDLDDVPWRKMMLMGKHQQGLRRVLLLSKVLPSLIEDSWLARKANALVITNPEEKKLVDFGRPVTALPNGFDFPSEPQFEPRPSQRILFFGSLFYYPNLDGVRWLLDEVWPLVIQDAPDAQLDIIGMHDPQQSRLSIPPGVTLPGFVDNLDKYIEDSAFLVVPLRIASGTRIKILEAWSKGLPVVSTPIGAEGLGAMAGSNILTGSSAAEFATACIQLLREPQMGAALARRAYTYGKENFSWESIYPTLDTILEGIHQKQISYDR